jgi:RNA polymerase sigma-70 factor (ECF subfamily)
LRREVEDRSESAQLASDNSPADDPHIEHLPSALEVLGPEQRAVVVLRYLLGYTPGEIADLLGYPRGTVNSRLRRALDRLAEQLEEENS